jgi:hypothetical protein
MTAATPASRTAASNDTRYWSRSTRSEMLPGAVLMPPSLGPCAAKCLAVANTLSGPSAGVVPW